MRNKDVINAWTQGTKAHTKHLITDGSTLWSYGMLIGKTYGGIKISIQANVSHTTNAHMRLAAQKSKVLRPAFRPTGNIYSCYTFPDEIDLNALFASA